MSKKIAVESLIRLLLGIVALFYPIRGLATGVWNYTLPDIISLIPGIGFILYMGYIRARREENMPVTPTEKALLSAGRYTLITMGLVWFLHLITVAGLGEFTMSGNKAIHLLIIGAAVFGVFAAMEMYWLKRANSQPKQKRRNVTEHTLPVEAAEKPNAPQNVVELLEGSRVALAEAGWETTMHVTDRVDGTRLFSFIANHTILQDVRSVVTFTGMSTDNMDTAFFAAVEQMRTSVRAISAFSDAITANE